MKKYLIIYNPMAGKVKRHHYLKKLEEAIIENGDDFKTIETKRAFDAYDEVKDNIEDFDYVVAAGGDGTINEVLTGLMESSKPHTPLGILPIGSGNDAYKYISDKVDPNEAIEIILAKNTKKIDIGRKIDKKQNAEKQNAEKQNSSEKNVEKQNDGRPNDKKQNSEKQNRREQNDKDESTLPRGKYMMNISSIGVDCLTSKTAGKMKKRVGGKLAYLFALIYSTLVFRKLHLKIELDEETIKTNSVLLCFGSGRFYGGGIKIMPWARYDDGYFHILNVIDLNNIMLLLFLPSVAFGVHKKIHRYVKVHKSKTIKITYDEKIDFNIDGEIYDDFSEVNYECIKGGLNLLYKNY